MIKGYALYNLLGLCKYILNGEQQVSHGRQMVVPL